MFTWKKAVKMERENHVARKCFSHQFVAVIDFGWLAPSRSRLLALPLGHWSLFAHRLVTRALVPAVSTRVNRHDGLERSSSLHQSQTVYWFFQESPLQTPRRFYISLLSRATPAVTGLVLSCTIISRPPRGVSRSGAPIQHLLSPSFFAVVKVVLWSTGLTWRSQVGANPIPIPIPLIWRYLGLK